MSQPANPDINSIVRQVIAQLRAAGGPVAGPSRAGRHGIFATVDEAVVAASEAFEQLEQLGMEGRKRAIAHIRRIAIEDAEELGQLEYEETGIAITQASDVTRYRLTGETAWRLVDRESGDVVLEDVASAFTGFDGTSSAFSAREARKAAETRLATELAELTINAITGRLSEDGAS